MAEASGLRAGVQQQQQQTARPTGRESAGKDCASVGVAVEMGSG
jgi:hypothetical protein